MSNELNNIIAHHSNGVCEGVAIGGDRYPGTTFIDHLLRYQNDPEVKMLVLLGEVGGVEEYDVCRALTDGRITKPIIAWCIGTCASMFSSEVQFGHAGACANAERETALAKNKALAEAGGHVPQSFDDLGEVIEKVYKQLVQDGTIVPREEVPPPTVPMDYSWARELGLIRKPASFMTSVSDERGQELLYAGMPISEVCSDTNQNDMQSFFDHCSFVRFFFSFKFPGAKTKFGYWWSDFAALVPAPSARLRLQIHRNVFDGDGRPRTGCLRCS